MATGEGAIPRTRDRTSIYVTEVRLFGTFGNVVFLPESTENWQLDEPCGALLFRENLFRAVLRLPDPAMMSLISLHATHTASGGAWSEICGLTSR